MSLATLAAAGLRGEELRVFAAASLSDALGEIVRERQAAGGPKIVLHFAASSTLARQIRAGARADVFFSADEPTLEALARHGLIAKATMRPMLGNTLVVVVHADVGAEVKGPADLAGAAVRRLALAEPSTVPAGIYAKAWLRRIGLWEAVERKVVGTENVRACLAAVEAGNADAGIVYKTDALGSTRVKIVHEVSADEGPRIVYPVAVTREARDPVAAAEFLAHLASAEAMAIFSRHGFLPATTPRP